MKIKITTFFVFILGLLLINSFFIKDFNYLVSGNHKFNNENFTGALDNYQKVINFAGVYNSLNSNYRLGNYDVPDYLNCEEGVNCFKLNHNLGNISFKDSLSIDDYDTKVSKLEGAINYYLEALKINYNEETEKNLEFVRQFLKDLEEESKEQENQEEEQNGDESQENGEEQEGEGNKDKNGSKSGEEREEKSSGENGSEGSEQSGNSGESSGGKGGLTEGQKEKLEQYSNALEKGQKDFGKYYNKVYDERRNLIDEFESFHNFDNSPLDGGNTQKDW